MLHILKQHKIVTILTIVALLVSTFYSLALSTDKKYPYPDMTRSEVENIVQQYLEEINVVATKPFNIESKADMPLGRHIDNELDREQFELVKQTLPIYTLQVQVGNIDPQIVHLNPLSKEVVGVENIPITLSEDETVENFVHNQFGSEYELVHTEAYDFHPMDLNYYFLNQYTDHKRYTFAGPLQIGELKEQIIVDAASTHGENIERHVISYMHTAEVAPQYMASQVENESLFEILLFLIIMFILFVLGLVTLIHFIVKAVKKEVAILLPLAITIFMSVFVLILSYVLLGYFGGLAWFEVLVSAWLVFFILAMTIPKDTTFLMQKTFSEQVSESLINMKKPILLGFCLAVISHPLSETFFLLASMIGGTWFSPATFYEIYLVENIWLLPLFVLAIGITAAIMEETVFRRYLVSIMDKIHPIFAVLVTSFLWAVLHIGYDVFPWYLRIIELTLVIGPFLYWVYKRYGFLTVIYCHYFFNSLLISKALFSFRLDVAIVSLLLTMSPLLIFLYKRHRLAIKQKSKSNLNVT